ncbi:hypothetical protein A2U01_0096478, partial [Trifolium medium]|nr:hypothetical protein [Trifolium medium]
DVRKFLQEGNVSDWGKVIEVREKKNTEGLGYVPTTKKGKSGDILAPHAFRSAGFIYAPPETNAVIEGDDEEEPPSFV